MKGFGVTSKNCCIALHAKSIKYVQTYALRRVSPNYKHFNMQMSYVRVKIINRSQTRNKNCLT